MQKVNEITSSKRLIVILISILLITLSITTMAITISATEHPSYIIHKENKYQLKDNEIESNTIAKLGNRDILKWKYSTTESTYISTPALVDLTGDGNLEIIFISDGNAVYALNHTGDLHWKQYNLSISRADQFMSAGSSILYLLPMFSSITPADITGDNKTELLFGAEDYVICLDNNGKILWNYGEGDRHYISTPVVMDLEGKKNPNKAEQEIFVIKDESYTHAIPEIFDTSGNILHSLSRPMGSTDFGMASLAVDDLDGSDTPDKYSDIIFGSRYSPLRLYTYDGTEFEREIPTNTFVYCAVYGTGAIGDFMGDTDLEYFIGTYEAQTGLANPTNAKGYYYLYDPINTTATAESDYRLYQAALPGSSNGILSSPVIGDVDCGLSNPKTSKIGYEGFITSYNGRIYCIDITSGDILWEFNTGSEITSSPALCNINLDNNLEVIVASNNGKIYCLDGNPSDGVDEGITDSGGTNYDLIWEYDTGGSGFWVSSPVVADINNDKSLEVLIGDKDGIIWCLDAGATKLPGQMDWPMFQHDKRNSGVYPQRKKTFKIQMDVINGDGDFGTTCFAKYKTYIFRNLIEDEMGFEDLKSVILTIDPDGYDIDIHWDRELNSYTKINDPENVIELVQTGDTSNTDYKNTWTIDFNIIFNWTFSRNQPISVSLQCYGYDNPTKGFFKKNFIDVVNKLTFKGDLEVLTEFQGIIRSGDWVRGGEEVQWSNLIAVYDGWENYYPDPNEFSVKVKDSMDNIWNYNPSTAGAPIIMVTNTPVITHPYNTVRFNFSDIPAQSIAPKTERTFILKIDNTTPEAPDSITLHADSFDDPQTKADDDTIVYATWTSANLELSGIKGYYYETIDGGGTKNGNFTIENQAVINANFEGDYNLYIWSVDGVGNIGSSKFSTIIIDTKEITYSLPDYDNWFNTSTIKVDTTIEDLNGSGIDPASIQYSIWKPNTDGFGPWLVINTDTDLKWGNEQHTIAILSANITFGENGINHLRWRAKDIAGNGYTESGYIRIKVDDSPITFSNPGYKQIDISKPKQIQCNITIIDHGKSGIKSDSIMYKVSTDGIDNYSAWKSVIINEIIDEPTYNVKITVVLNYGNDNYIRWRAKDISDTGWQESGNIKIIVNSPPIIKINSPLDMSIKRYYYETPVEFDATDTCDPDPTDILTYKWIATYTTTLGQQKEDEIGDQIKFESRLNPGFNVITFYVSDGNFNLSKSVDIFIFDRNTDLDDDGMPDYWEDQYIGLNPENGSDSLTDLDGDGFNNYKEFESSTNPADPTDYPGKKETSDKDSVTDSSTFIIINLMVLIIVIILLISLFLSKRSKIKKERMKNLKTKTPTVMLRRESLSPTHPSIDGRTSYGPGMDSGLGSELAMKTVPGTISGEISDQEQVSVPQQEPMPKLPPYQTQTQKPSQKPKYNNGDSELIYNNDLKNKKVGDEK